MISCDKIPLGINHFSVWVDIPQLCCESQTEKDRKLPVRSQERKNLRNHFDCGRKALQASLANTPLLAAARMRKF